MSKEIANTVKKEIYIKCKKCGIEVFSITHGSLTPCKCGTISVDGSEELVRVIGKPGDYEEIQK